MDETHDGAATVADKAPRPAVTITIGGCPPGLDKLAQTIDSRTGGAVVVDGAGNIHRLQILQELRNGVAGPQDLYYCMVGPNDMNMAFQPLNVHAKYAKVYSVDGAAIQTVNGTPTIVFLIEVSDVTGQQAKHLCYLNGATVVAAGR